MPRSSLCCVYRKGVYSKDLKALFRLNVPKSKREQRCVYTLHKRKKETKLACQITFFFFSRFSFLKYNTLASPFPAHPRPPAHISQRQRTRKEQETRRETRRSLLVSIVPILELYNLHHWYVRSALFICSGRCISSSLYEYMYLSLPFYPSPLHTFWEPISPYSAWPHSSQILLPHPLIP